jgi:hypothetical protein
VFKAPIKRKIGYSDGEDEIMDTKRRMNNMAMNNRE